ncbi:hypothetical protein GXW77_14480, partial [Roseomonas alkaliterrae]|nr:hypothetical protein [Neoroseomonas alkaliterrae]
LPAGAVLMLAGLGAASVPAAGERWTARVAGLGRAQALIGEASSGEDAPAA